MRIVTWIGRDRQDGPGLRTSDALFAAPLDDFLRPFDDSVAPLFNFEKSPASSTGGILHFRDPYAYPGQPRGSATPPLARSARPLLFSTTRWWPPKWDGDPFVPTPIPTKSPIRQAVIRDALPRFR